MPSSIPYYPPSLVPGNIIDFKILKLVKTIENLQLQVEAAQQKMQSYISMKRSLSMTINELIGMNVNVSELSEKIKEIDQSISDAASNYISIKLNCETEIQKTIETLTGLNPENSPESPLDFTESKIKQLPWASESLKLDAQYFSFEGKMDHDPFAAIEKYVRDTTEVLGSKSSELAKVASSHTKQQAENHKLSGTLIIAASCSHKNVSVIEPFILDPDKAVNIWNSIKENENDKIDTSSIDLLLKQLEADSDKGISLPVLSGVVNSSSFIGMVHYLKSDPPGPGSLEKLSDQLNERLTIGGWLENASGGFGIDPAIKNEVRKMLGSPEIASHISVITMGATPSISSNQVQMGIKKLIPSKQETSGKLIKSQAGDTNETNSINAAADEAKAGKQLINLQKSKTHAILNGLGDIDKNANRILDINSMMSAFENYLEAIKSTNDTAGIPIGFLTKKVGKSDIIHSWISKYYPKKETIKDKSEYESIFH